MSEKVYIGFEVKKSFKDKINDYIKKNGYSSLSEFIRESIRKNMKDN